MKKVISMILVLVMTAALFCTPAFAAAAGSKSTIQDVVTNDGEPILIFWDEKFIFEDYEDKENSKIIAYTTEDVVAMIETAKAELAAKQEDGSATKEELARAEFLADVDPEVLAPLYVSHFEWADNQRNIDKIPISFELSYEGFEGAKILMMYRDWNDLTENAYEKPTAKDGKTVWTLVDTTEEALVRIDGVNKGTIAVFIVPAAEAEAPTDAK